MMRVLMTKISRIEIVLTVLMTIYCTGCEKSYELVVDEPNTYCQIPDRIADGELFAIVQEGTVSDYEVCAVPPAATNSSLPLDVFFLVDTTASMGLAIDNLKNNLTALSTQIGTLTSDVRYGLGTFQDYPESSSSGSGDYAYRLEQGLSSNLSLIRNKLNSISLGNGGDYPESAIEGLYQAGKSISGWRSDSKKVIVLVTDDEFKTPTSGRATYSQMKTSLKQLGIEIIGISVKSTHLAFSTEGIPVSGSEVSDYYSFSDLSLIARDTGSLSRDGIDLNGDGDLLDSVDIHPSAPLVFKVLEDGTPASGSTADIASSIALGLQQSFVPSIVFETSGGDSGLVQSTDLGVVRVLENANGTTEECFQFQVSGYPRSSCGIDVYQSNLIVRNLSTGKVIRNVPIVIQVLSNDIDYGSELDRRLTESELELFKNRSD